MLAGGARCGGRDWCCLGWLLKDDGVLWMGKGGVWRGILLGPRGLALLVSCISRGRLWQTIPCVCGAMGKKGGDEQVAFLTIRSCTSMYHIILIVIYAVLPFLPMYGGVHAKQLLAYPTGVDHVAINSSSTTGNVKLKPSALPRGHIDETSSVQHYQYNDTIHTAVLFIII